MWAAWCRSHPVRAQEEEWSPTTSTAVASRSPTTSGGATGYAGYAPAYPVFPMQQQIHICIFNKKKEKNSSVMRVSGASDRQAAAWLCERHAQAHAAHAARRPDDHFDGITEPIPQCTAHLFDFNYSVVRPARACTWLRRHGVSQTHSRHRVADRCRGRLSRRSPTSDAHALRYGSTYTQYANTDQIRSELFS